MTVEDPSTTAASLPDAPPHWMSQQWESNYKEAAIFLEEGTDNRKFTHHPR